MIRSTILIAVIAFSPLNAQEARIVPDSFHLTGAHVIVYPPRAGDTVRQRVLITGVRSGGGCGFHSRGPGGAGWMEWVVEYDTENCLQIRARGLGTRPQMRPSAHYRETNASLQLDTARTPATEELHIRVCANANLATDAPCNGSARQARMTSRGGVVRSGPLRGDTLALPGEVQAVLSSGDDVSFVSAADTEYVHVEVFTSRSARPSLTATGRNVRVRRSPRDGTLQIEARWPGRAQ